MLPQNFIDTHKSKIKGSRMFGIPIEELSKEELMVSLICMGEMYTKALESNIRDMRFMSDLHKASRNL